VHLAVDGDAAGFALDVRPPDSRVRVRWLESDGVAGVQRLARLFDVRGGGVVVRAGWSKRGLDVHVVAHSLRESFPDAPALVLVGFGRHTLSTDLRGVPARRPLRPAALRHPWSVVVVDVTREEEPLLPRVWTETPAVRILTRVVVEHVALRCEVAWFVRDIKGAALEAYLRHHRATLAREAARLSKRDLHVRIVKAECEALTHFRSVPDGQVTAVVATICA